MSNVRIHIVCGWCRKAVPENEKIPCSKCSVDVFCSQRCMRKFRVRKGCTIGCASEIQKNTDWLQSHSDEIRKRCYNQRMINPAFGGFHFVLDSNRQKIIKEIIVPKEDNDKLSYQNTCKCKKEELVTVGISTEKSNMGASWFLTKMCDKE